MKLHLLTVSIAAALCAAVPIGVRADAPTPPELGENDHRVVFVDQNNVPSVTNALATQAQMAAEAAKVELALAKQEANEAEPAYQTAFRVTGTLEMLRALKRFLVDGGYVFETIKEGE